MLEFFNNENNNISKTLEKNLCICCYFLPLIDIINGFSEELFSTAGWIATYNTYVFPILFIYNKYYQWIFIIFMLLYFLIVRSKIKTSIYTRFNVMQSLLLYLTTSTIDFFFCFFPNTLANVGVRFITLNLLFIILIVPTLYALVLVSRGQYPLIPIFSGAARLHITKQKLKMKQKKLKVYEWILQLDVKNTSDEISE